MPSATMGMAPTRWTILMSVDPSSFSAYTIRLKLGLYHLPGIPLVFPLVAAASGTSEVVIDVVVVVVVCSAVGAVPATTVGWVSSALVNSATTMLEDMCVGLGDKECAEDSRLINKRCDSVIQCLYRKLYRTMSNALECK